MRKVRQSGAVVLLYILLMTVITTLFLVMAQSELILSLKRNSDQVGKSKPIVVYVLLALLLSSLIFRGALFGFLRGPGRFLIFGVILYFLFKLYQKKILIHKKQVEPPGPITIELCNLCGAYKQPSHTCKKKN